MEDGVPQYRLIGFCDCRGRAARDVTEDRDVNELHRRFLARCAAGMAYPQFPELPRGARLCPGGHRPGAKVTLGCVHD